jgi:endonuclease YncB( thermonuclease family)
MPAIVFIITGLPTTSADRPAPRNAAALFETDAGGSVIALAPFLCTVTHAHDDDRPLWCSSGAKFRIAGVQAPDFESASPCRTADLRRVNYRCDNAAAQRSQQIVERLVLRQTLRCEATGKSYARVVARCMLPDGRSLSCAAIASGAAVRWDRYWRQYRMGECR